jgi:trk system potassium uptake protein TrkA
MLIGAIVRDGTVIIPRSQDRVQPGDTVIAMVTYRALRKAEAMLAGDASRAA